MGEGVLHYVRRWLPLSSGFVHAHIVHSARDGVVVTPLPLEHADSFPLPASRPVRSMAPIARVTPPGHRRPLSVALAVLAARHRVGLVHVHLGYGVADVVGVVRRRRLPLVLSLHGEDATASAAATDRYADVFGVVDAVITPSEFLARKAAALGFDPSLIHAVPSGVDTAFFVPTPMPARPPSALFVGRLVEKKGIDVLLAAWPAVRAAMPGATLRVIGDGPLRPLLDDLPAGVVHELPDPGRRSAQVRDAMVEATVVVQPSRTGSDGDAESLLLVNLEAQASGRPVVTTRHGGIPEFVHDGTTALLVPEGDVDALVAAIASVLADPDRAAALGAAGPAWAARFDVRACTARVDAVYDDLLARRSTK